MFAHALLARALSTGARDLVRTPLLTLAIASSTKCSLLSAKIKQNLLSDLLTSALLAASNPLTPMTNNLIPMNTNMMTQ